MNSTQFLKALPFQVTVPTLEGSYPLHLASMQGHFEVAKLLVTILLCHSGCLDTESSCANETFESALNFRDNKGCTCLHLAVECGSVELVQYFLGLEKSDQNEVRNQGKSGEKVSTTLMQIDALNDDGRTALHLSIVRSSPECRNNYLQILKLLLEHGANPNMAFEVMNLLQNNSKRETTLLTPLLEAVKRHDEEMVKLLLKFRAKDENLSAAKLAIKSQEQSLIDIFLENQIYFHTEIVINLEGHSCKTCQDLKSSISYKALGSGRSLCNSYPGLMVDWNSLGLVSLNPNWFQEKEDLCMEYRLHPRPFCFHLITELDLSHNLLKELPFFVWNLENLKKLNLSNNQVFFCFSSLFMLCLLIYKFIYFLKTCI